MAGPEINLIVLRCTDLQSTRQFYETLGLSFVDEQHGGGPAHLSAITSSGTVFELYPTPDESDPSAGTQGVRLGFVVDDLDAVVQDAVAGGVALVSRDEGRVVVVDPDGRKVELEDGARIPPIPAVDRPC